MDEILLGGDWNASLENRIGYTTDLQGITRLADARLREWIENNQLIVVNTQSWTWECNKHTTGPIQQASLDFFVTKSSSY